MNAAKTNASVRAVAPPKPILELENTVNKAVALINLLQARLSDQAGTAIYPSLPGFDAEISSEICGIQTLANEVKMELLNCAKLEVAA